MVDVSVDFLGLTVLFEETSEDSSAAHPKNLSWHTGVLGTLSATFTGVTTY